MIMGINNLWNNLPFSSLKAIWYFIPWGFIVVSHWTIIPCTKLGRMSKVICQWNRIGISYKICYFAENLSKGISFKNCFIGKRNDMSYLHSSELRWTCRKGSMRPRRKHTHAHTFSAFFWPVYMQLCRSLLSRKQNAKHNQDQLSQLFWNNIFCGPETGQETNILWIFLTFVSGDNRTRGGCYPVQGDEKNKHPHSSWFKHIPHLKWTNTVNSLWLYTRSIARLTNSLHNGKQNCIGAIFIPVMVFTNQNSAVNGSRMHRTIRIMIAATCNYFAMLVQLLRPSPAIASHCQ